MTHIQLKILDLGCWKHKLPGAFGVDIMPYDCVDLIWDLNNELPTEFHNNYAIVHSNQVLDHIGNPLNFLIGCKKYLKPNGKLILKVDNGDYWRFHSKLGNYHAEVFEIEDPDHPETHHKMMFQMKHITKMLETLGFKITITKYYRTYADRPVLKRLRMGHVDYILPKRKGCNMMLIEAVLLNKITDNAAQKP